MKKHRRYFGIILASVLSTTIFEGCGQLPDHRKYGSEDLKPPVLLNLYPRDASTVVVQFDEPLKDFWKTAIYPELEAEEGIHEGSSGIISCLDKMIPGKKYTLEARASDLHGNTMTFLYPFYGYNPHPPQVLINEVTTQGSSAHPDRVELLALEGGNMAGLCFTEGTTDTWKTRLIFPPMEVTAGEFLIIHCKPEGLLGEVDEVEKTDLSEGKDVHSEVRDFWLPQGKGLGGNNGVLALYAYPGGPLLDGFLYSNRTSSSDEKYRGFGSLAVMEMADQLYDEGGWHREGELIAPEDGVNPESSTATRSICRMPGGIDEDRADDWHVVDTGEASFGEVNSEKLYID